MLRSLTIITFCFCATIAVAERRAFGNIVYDVPQGWEPGRDDNGTQVLLSDLPNDVCEFCYIYLAASQPATGTLESFMRNNMDRFVDPDDDPDITLLQNPEPMQASGVPAMLMGLRVDRDIQVLAGYDLGDTFELVGFEGNAYSDAEIAETTDVLTNQVNRFFDQLGFLSAGAPDPMPAPTAGKMTGLWWGTELGIQYGLDLSIRYVDEHTLLSFWPNGYFYEGTPPTGYDPFDAGALRARADVSFGTYQQTRRTLTLTYANGVTRQFRKDGSGWAEDDLTINRVKPLPDGSRIQGEISSFSYTGPSPATGGGVASSSNTVFAQNGTYTGARFGSFTGSGVVVSSDRSTGGTYEVKNGLLISTPRGGGPSVQEVIFRANGEVFIGDQLLETD